VLSTPSTEDHGSGINHYLAEFAHKTESMGVPLDGIAITAAAAAIAPSGYKMSTAIIVGLAHAIFHPIAVEARNKH
jgi:hypothetical protein